MKLFIFDPSLRDPLGQARGGGRVIQTLRENFPEATFISDLLAPRSSKSEVGTDLPADLSSVALAKGEALAKDGSTLLIPYWKPFEPPILTKRIASKQFLIIFDVIPLKYPKNFPAGIRGKLNLWKNKQALRHFDGVITISEAAKKDIIKYLPLSADKVSVVYPTTSKIFWNAPRHSGEERSDDSSEKRFALYVGDVNWNKNLVNLARAIKLADVSCVFVGKNFEPFASKTPGVESAQTPGVNMAHVEQREFTNFLKLTRNDKRFIFAGQVSDQELINLYKQAVCNLLVSHYEGFGLSYLEAATQHCPSVLSDIPVFHEIASEGALYANPNEPEAISIQIKKYFDDKSLRDEMGNRAYTRALDLFSPEKFRQSLKETLL